MKKLFETEVKNETQCISEIKFCKLKSNDKKLNSFQLNENFGGWFESSTGNTMELAKTTLSD